MTQIQVTERHIVDGICGDVSKCAVALALEDLLKDDLEPSVGSYIIIYKYNRIQWEVATPKEVRDFIEKFDKASPLTEPFSFNLDIPEKLLK